MNLGFPKQKLDLNQNESENLSDFGFAKNNVLIRQHSDSNCVTSLLVCVLSCL